MTKIPTYVSLHELIRTLLENGLNKEQYIALQGFLTREYANVANCCDYLFNVVNENERFIYKKPTAEEPIPPIED